MRKNNKLIDCEKTLAVHYYNSVYIYIYYKDNIKYNRKHCLHEIDAKYVSKQSLVSYWSYHFEYMMYSFSIAWMVVVSFHTLQAFLFWKCPYNFKTSSKNTSISFFSWLFPLSVYTIFLLSFCYHLQSSQNKITLR